MVEVDGSQHAENTADRRRDGYMNEKGWSVLRFWNVDVLKEREQVLETILAVLEERLSSAVVANDMRFAPAKDREG